MRILAALPRLGAGVAVARILDTCEPLVIVGAMVGVVERESWDELKKAEIVEDKEGPKPPTGAQRRVLRVLMSGQVHEVSDMNVSLL